MIIKAGEVTTRYPGNLELRSVDAFVNFLRQHQALGLRHIAPAEILCEKLLSFGDHFLQRIRFEERLRRGGLEKGKAAFEATSHQPGMRSSPAFVTFIRGHARTHAGMTAERGGSSKQVNRWHRNSAAISHEHRKMFSIQTRDESCPVVSCRGKHRSKALGVARDLIESEYGHLPLNSLQDFGGQWSSRIPGRRKLVRIVLEVLVVFLGDLEGKNGNDRPKNVRT